MSSSTFVQHGAVSRSLLVCGLWLGGAVATWASVTEVSGPMFAQTSASSRPVAAPVTPKPDLDELVYRDGDRLRGRLIERKGDTLVFQSERFGLLRVPIADADVTLAQPPPPTVAAAVESGDTSDVAVERWPFSPHQMAEALKQMFGSWHGRFSVAAEVLENTRDQNSSTVEARLQRKWEEDEIQMTGRYDYASVAEVTSTDMVKADGVWRHDLPKRLFTVYRPSLEWNRAYYRDDVPSDYVLLQQEVGAGVNLFATDTRNLRVGVSENLFDVWVTPTQNHISQTVESLFAEFEAKLPWRIALTNRGVWYYSFQNNDEGWENRFEISKKLTETLTVGARHETRRNNPDVRSADYQRLRLLFGFDF